MTDLMTKLFCCQHIFKSGELQTDQMRRIF